MSFKDIKTAFYGSSLTVCESLARQVDLTTIFCERRHFSQELYNFSCISSIDFISVNSKEAINTNKYFDLGISFGFGYIFLEEQIKRHEHGIWNIHTGKLATHRGRHPVGWAIIQNEKELTVSIHQINEEIDKGMLIAESEIPIYSNDDEETLFIRIEENIASSLLSKAANNFFSGSLSPVLDGIYQESLEGKWDNINPSELDSTFVYNLVRSKKRYGGVLVGGNKVKYCDFVHLDNEEFYNKKFVYICNDGKEVYLR